MDPATTDRDPVHPDAGAERTEGAAPAHFFPVEDWALANHLGVNAVYEMCRMRHPIPHIHLGRRRLIDDGPAAEWLRRNHGEGYPQDT